MSVKNSCKCTANARVHLFARRVHFAAGAALQQADLPAALCDSPARARAARLDAAIAACLPVMQTNLKELGYGN
ncbi:MAG: hypothetical protein Kow0020_11360 [Wenzhouxiangellaceae bacterium]